MSAATIIAAIDTAIENWAGKPISLSVNGRAVTYRSLAELIEARKYYGTVDSATGDIRDGFKIANFRPGGCI